MKITIEGTEQEIKISSQLSEVVKRIKTAKSLMNCY